MRVVFETSNGDNPSVETNAKAEKGVTGWQDIREWKEGNLCEAKENECV